MTVVNVKLQIRWHPFQLVPDAPKEGIDKRDYYRKKFGAQSERMADQMSRVCNLWISYLHANCVIGCIVFHLSGCWYLYFIFFHLDTCRYLRVMTWIITLLDLRKWKEWSILFLLNVFIIIKSWFRYWLP